MNFLPEGTILVNLEIIDIYDVYDKPVLFSCKNKSGLIFIVICVDSNDLVEIWLYAPISLLRFKNVIQGEVELRNIFINAEDNFVYQVEVPYEDSYKIFVKTINCHEISDKYLPASGEVLETTKDFSYSNLETVSRQKKREISDRSS